MFKIYWVVIFALDASISTTELIVNDDGSATVKSLYTDPVLRVNGFDGLDVLIYKDLEGKERTLLDVVGADPVAP